LAAWTSLVLSSGQQKVPAACAVVTDIANSFSKGRRHKTEDRI
jgi:hypothetical protein